MWAGYYDGDAMGGRAGNSEVVLGGSISVMGFSQKEVVARA